MVFAARLTQRGQTISSMDDLLALYEQSFTDNTAAAIASLPHPTLQKFAVLTVAIVGASRRFLAQITRHQNEVKFMSASLQYSNYSGQADFVVPYEILTASESIRRLYLESCQSDMSCYEQLCNAETGHDAAGYATPQGLRNVLIISATPYQWKHMISQRVCRRNTDETRIVLLKIWQELFSLSPVLFTPSLTGPFCQMDKCLEGKMTCGRKLPGNMTPEDILRADYPAIMEGGSLLAFPFVLLTGILYGFCKFFVLASGAVMGILSGIIFLAALVLFFIAGFWPGMSWLVLAFLLSPYGLPMVAVWLVGMIGGVNGALKDFIFG